MPVVPDAGFIEQQYLWFVAADLSNQQGLWFIDADFISGEFKPYNFYMTENTFSTI